jgi:hypothetical protein
MQQSVRAGVAQACPPALLPASPAARRFSSQLHVQEILGPLDVLLPLPEPAWEWAPVTRSDNQQGCRLDVNDDLVCFKSHVTMTFSSAQTTVAERCSGDHEQAAEQRGSKQPASSPLGASKQRTGRIAVSAVRQSAPNGPHHLAKCVQQLQPLLLAEPAAVQALDGVQ